MHPARGSTTFGSTARRGRSTLSASRSRPLSEEIQVFVRAAPPLKTFAIIANNSDTVGDIKSKIAKITDVSPPAFYLTFQGRLLEDDAVLRDVGIEDFSQIDMHLSMPYLSASRSRPQSKEIQVFVRAAPPLKTFTMFANDSDTVGDIKSEIARITGAFLPAIYLTFQGRRLNDATTLKDAGIDNFSLIDMHLRMPYLSASCSRPPPPKEKIGSLLEQRYP
jgi:hypothetical protein